MMSKSFEIERLSLFQACIIFKGLIFWLNFSWDCNVERKYNCNFKFFGPIVALLLAQPFDWFDPDQIVYRMCKTYYFLQDSQCLKI